MALSIDPVEVKFAADLAQLRRDMEQVKSIVGNGAAQMERQMAGVSAGFGAGFAREAQMVQSALGAIGVSLSAAGFGTWIKGAIDAADRLNDLSKSTDLAASKLAGLQLAARQSGGELGGIADSINKLSMNIGKDADKFAKIGITAKEPIEAFKQLADIYASLEDPQLRAAVAAQALGRGWQSAAPLLKEGGAAIQAMIDKGERLSGMTQGLVDASDEFNDRMAEFQAALSGSANALAAQMLPLLTDFAESLTDTADAANQTSAAFSPLTEALRALIVLGGNVGFVFRGIGVELGGLAAQAAAVARGDLSGAAAIGDMMKADAERARAAFDEWEKKMMAAGTAAVRNVKKAIADEAARLEKAFYGPSPGANTVALRGFVGGDDAAKKAAQDAERLAKAEFDARQKIIQQALEHERALIEQAHAKGLLNEKEYQEELYKAQIAGIAKRAAAVQKQLNAETDTTKRVELQSRLNDLQAESAKAADAYALATIKLNAASKDYLGTLAKENDGLAERVKKAKEELAAIGLTVEEKERLSAVANEAAAAQYEEAAAAYEAGRAYAELTGNTDAQRFYESLRDEALEAAAALREIAGIETQQAAKRVAVKAGEDSAKAWENFSRDIEQSLTDALMRGFESGEGFGENFVKTLQNTLKTAALKIAVQMVVQPAMGRLGQALVYTQAGAGGGGLGNIFSLANNFTGGGGMYGNFATSAAGQSLGLSALVPGIFEEAAALGVGGAVGGGGAALTGLGTALPYIGIGLGLLSLFGGDLFGGKEKPPVAAWTQFPQGSKDWGIPLATPWGDLRFAGQHMGDTEAEVAKLRDAFAPIAQRDYAISGMLTGDENKRIEQAIAGYTTGEMEDYSEAAMRAHFEKRLDLVSDAIGGWVDEIADAFVGDLEGSYTAIATLLSVRGVEGAEELARAFIGTFETAAGEAIVQAQSGTFMDGFINDLNAGGADGSLVSSLSREGETAADTFARLVNDLVGVREAFDLMGRAALDFSLAAADMASSIIEAAGGAEAFKGKFSAYYAEFYTEQERLAKHTERTAAEFDKLGLAMPDSHAAFRDLVDGIDLTSAAGQELFASLLDLAPAFDIVADASAAAAEQAIQSAQAAAAQLAQLAQGRRALEIELQDALGNGAIAEAMRREDTLAGLDPSLRGLQQQIWSALDAAAAQARAAQDMAAKRELEIQLMEAQGNDAGATAARRALELEGTDEALRSLKQQIWAAQDARVAAEEAARMQAEAARMQAEAAEAARRAAEEQARAQQALRDGWQRVADSIWDTMRRLRGDILGPEQTFARAQSEFAIATAQARAGNQDAAGQLPTLAQAVVELGKSQASTAVEQALLTARTLASLDRTVKGLAQTFGLEVPAYAAGSSFIPRDTLALVHEGERIIPAADNRALMQALGGGDMAAELRALRAEVALLRQANSAENSAIANHARTAADVLDSSARGGRSLYTRTTA